MDSKETNFVVKMGGFCFLCLNQIQLIPEHSSSIQSIQYLSKYLKLDMRKVFQGPVPDNLLEKVERSRLKAELCLDCSNLNAKLSKCFEQLERIEMEIIFRLEAISDKINYSKESRRMELIKSTIKYTNSELNADDLTRKLEIAQILRDETSTKCSAKLNNLNESRPIPKVKIEKTKWKKPIAQFKEDAINHIKVENPLFPATDDDFLDFDMNPVEDDYVHSISISPEAVTVKTETVNKNGRKLQSNKTIKSSSNKMKGNRKFKVVGSNGKNLPNVPPPVKSARIVKPDYGAIARQLVINPKNGNHQCRICKKEYSLNANFVRHFKNVHMKVRYKCPVPACGKSFDRKDNYDCHYNSLHLGMRQQCKICIASFSAKSNLARHVKTVHKSKSY